MATRRCATCRTSDERGTLLRLVASPDGQVVPDLRLRLPGRGLNVCFRRSCIEKLARKGRLQRTLGVNGGQAVVDDLLGRLLPLLASQLREALGLAAGAGQLVSGGGTCLRMLDRGDGRAVLLSEDAAENTVDRFTRRAAVHDIPVARLPFGATELGQALGKPSRSVVVPLRGDLSDLVQTRLRRFRAVEGD